jgi:ferritin-like metal-binding protein YciE
MKATTLHDLFLQDLQSAVTIEEQIIKALPKMTEKATSPALKDALKNHLAQTKKQHQTVSDLTKEMGIDQPAVSDPGIEGIIQKGEEMLTSNEPSPVLDLGIIEAAQRVEHYEMATYGTLANYAQEMGHQDAQDLLH